MTVGVDVRGPDGRPVAGGPLERRGATVVVPLPALDQPGPYTVAWRAANDEHPFTGEYTIVLDLPAPTTTTTAPAPTTTEVAATASIPARSSGSSDSGGSLAVVVISAVGVAIALAILVAGLVRRSRGERPPG